MKSLKVAKINFENIMKSSIIYYCIFVCVIIFLISISTEGTTMSGLEISTVIFLFVCGLNSFKSNFYFAKSNGISRKTFIKGILISSIPIALVMSIMDIIINRISSIFIKNATFYDMTYWRYIGNAGEIYENNWLQSNSISTIFNTILFQFSFCLLAYVAGIVINMIYYRSNKYVKVLVSVTPVMLIIFNTTLPIRNPRLAMKLNEFLDYIFGFDPLNVFACITTFLVITVILSGIAFLLIRKAVIKER